ncbi:NUMOD4 domain-containing protein [Albimonas pacifica]|uniref:NUMOD4 domain-containing protein n=1 Tax=Albimonas pacifica TaxID=1114924 RepID=UPI000B814DF4
MDNWKPVLGFETCYEVSDDGRVRRTRGGHGAKVGRLLRPQINNKGYVQFCLCQNSKARRHLAHRLV